MALQTFESDLDTAVASATSFADLVNKYAQLAAGVAKEIPGGLGTEVTAGAQVVASVDSLLHTLQGLLPSLSSATPKDDGDSDGGD